MDFFIDYVAGDRQWHPVVQGWRTQTDTWGVNHDLLHHMPGDTGTVGQELATLGAELYIEFEADTPLPDGRLLKDSRDALVAVCEGAHGFIGADIHELEKGPEHFMLEAAPAVEGVPFEVLDIFHKGAEGVHKALLEHTHNDENWQEALACLAQQEVVVSWMAYGYVRAKERFPDKARLKAGMAQSNETLRSLLRKHRGATIRLRFQDYQLHAEVLQ